MNNTDYLISKGWKLASVIRRGIEQSWQAWDHPDHQHNIHGFFQKGEAIRHQKALDRGECCDCIPRDGGRR